MWAHYAASHCGIAIEYDINHLTRFCPKQLLHRFPVSYAAKPPKLDILTLQDNAGQAVRTMLGYKSPKWAYEEESRVLLENMNGEIPHDYRAIKSITFGLKVPNSVREFIHDVTKHKVLKYYEICKIEETYELERKGLSDFHGQQPTGGEPNINWESHFEMLDKPTKKVMINLAEAEINSDPHFQELFLAEKSTNDSSQVVVTYQSKHNMKLPPASEFTKHYYKL